MKTDIQPRRLPLTAAEDWLAARSTFQQQLARAAEGKVREHGQGYSRLENQACRPEGIARIALSVEAREIGLPILRQR